MKKITKDLIQRERQQKSKGKTREEKREGRKKKRRGNKDWGWDEVLIREVHYLRTLNNCNLVIQEK